MTFPTVTDVTETGGLDTNTTTHTFNFPTTVDANDLLLGMVSSDGNTASITWPSPWNEIFDVEADATGVRLSVAWMKAVGDEDGTTFAVTTANTQKACCAIYRIPDAIDPDTQAPEISTGAVGDSTAPNPDSLTPTGGAQDYLYVAVCGVDRGIAGITWPTYYNDNQTSTINGNSNGQGASMS